MRTKKMLVLLLALLSMVAFGSVSFAAQDTNKAGATLVLDDDGTNKKLEIAVSPSVNATYINDDDANPQWYCIGTYHSGGTKTYATAQDITKIFYQEALDFSGLPAVAQSEDAWSDNWRQ